VTAEGRRIRARKDPWYMPPGGRASLILVIAALLAVLLVGVGRQPQPRTTPGPSCTGAQAHAVVSQ
jgi:hypothetical protein